MLSLNLSDIAFITVKGIYYWYIIHDISKYDAIHLLENSLLDDLRYIENAHQKINIKNRAPYTCDLFEVATSFLYSKSRRIEEIQGDISKEKFVKKMKENGGDFENF